MACDLFGPPYDDREKDKLSRKSIREVGRIMHLSEAKTKRLLIEGGWYSTKETRAVKDYVWVFPYVVFTNDPTPPSETLSGVTVEKFAVVCTGTVVLPGVHIGQDALIGAGTNLTKDVPEMSIVVGNPGKVIGSVTKIKNEKGEQVYPWRYSFDRGMPWKGCDYDTYIASKMN